MCDLQQAAAKPYFPTEATLGLELQQGVQRNQEAKKTKTGTTG